MRIGCRLALIVLAAWLFPATAFAQGAITGVVRDTSGAVLPGVTVEASSPALIEKVRTATTDSSGQYRIEDLRPGSYVVTFTLGGFSTVRREGIELTGYPLRCAPVPAARPGRPAVRRADRSPAGPTGGCPGPPPR